MTVNLQLMIPARQFLIVVISLIASLAFGDRVTRKEKLPDFKVAAISAQLYYESTGKMSADVLASPNFALFNTFIGGGDAQASSETTLVVVEISCPKEQINVPKSRKLSVRVTQGTKVIAMQQLAFPFVEPTGKIFMPVLVYGHNEKAMKVTATITGQAHASTLTKMIGFSAGE
jgi:hypothetical protein